LYCPIPKNVEELIRKHLLSILYDRAAFYISVGQYVGVNFVHPTSSESMLGEIIFFSSSARVEIELFSDSTGGDLPKKKRANREARLLRWN